MSEVRRVGEFKLGWGESLCWDERAERLLFVDCAANTLHWLDGAEPPLRTLHLPSLPTGVVLADDGRVVVALDDGLNLVDPESDTIELLTPYPQGLGGRANDAAADFDGGLITGTLNIEPGPGSLWRFSSRDGWSHLADDIGNTNGPVVVGGEDGKRSLIVADTLAARLYAFDDYDGASSSIGERRVLLETGEHGGLPDGACADADGATWSCLLAAGQIVRCTSAGVERSLGTSVELPSDVAFGGSNLDRMFCVSISVPVAGMQPISENAGSLLEIGGHEATGRVEPRFAL